MILILTGPGDQHADHVASKLRKRSAAYFRFNPAQFPRAAEVSLSYDRSGLSSYKLRAGEEQVDLHSLRAVWYRRPEAPQAHVEIKDVRARQFVERECKTFLQELWGALDCRWLPAAPPIVREASLKASQLRLAGDLGFELPPTLITNSAAEMLEFYKRYDGHIVSKLVSPALFDTMGDEFIRYTEMVSRRDIAHMHAIQYCPMIFQAYVPKRVELRITVVGDRVFAAEIHSQASNHTRLDWRRYDQHQTPYCQHELPRDVEGRCVKLVEKLGLQYGAIDMVLTPDGRYVFLEINPNGQYLWIEYATGLPISDAVCDLLMTGSAVDSAPAQICKLSAEGAM